MSDVSEPQDVSSQLFNKFCDSNDLQEILTTFQSLCTEAQISNTQPGFYGQLKSKLSDWRSKSLWEILDKKVDCPVYDGQSVCRGANVLVVGGGPCGLRFAVEAALLGAGRVVVVEKRRGYGRNNVLHLWPYLITDLRTLGAKKFFGKFCAGSLDHISIRRLECILLKVSLILGVHVYSGVHYNDVIEPTGGHGWRASFQPTTSPISEMDFNVIIGADGRKSGLLKRGFKQKEFRAQLAIAITANFVHGNTTAEASVPEISGVAYIYHQDFFNKLSAEFGIDLENIVYYKDETHYFVMTAKKHSLLKKGVLKQDHNDAVQLVANTNVNPNKLYQYAKEAAEYVTEKQLPHYNFEPMADGRPDVALFDFTSMYAADHAARILERSGKCLMLALVGDSILEPFWPLGTGAARGFLSAMDAAWMMKKFINGGDPLQLLAERENIFHLLPQTAPKKLLANHAGFTINPTTRYPAINACIGDTEVAHLYDTDREGFPLVKPPNEPALLRKKSSKSGALGQGQAKKVKGAAAPASDVKARGPVRHRRPPRFYIKKNRQSMTFAGSGTPSPRLMSPPPSTETTTLPTINQTQEPEAMESAPSVGTARGLELGIENESLANQGGSVVEGQKTTPGHNRVKSAVEELKKSSGGNLKSEIVRESHQATSNQATGMKSSKKEDGVVGKWKQQQLNKVNEGANKAGQGETKQADRQEQEKKEKLEKEDREKKDKSKKELLEKEKKEREKLEKERKQKEKLEKEKAKKEKERLEKEKKERERLEKVRKEKERKEREMAEKEKEKRGREIREKEKKERERADKEKEKKENEKKEREAREKEKKERERAEKEQKKKDQKKQSRSETNKVEVRNKQLQEDQTSEKQQTKENEFLREQALRLKPTGRLSNTAGGERSSLSPSQHVAEASKPTFVKEMSSPGPSPGNSATHASNNQVQRGNVAREMEAGRHVHRVNTPKSFISEESRGHHKVVRRERSHPHGRGGEEELIKRVSRVVRATSIKHARPASIIRRSRRSVGQKHARDEVDVMGKRAIADTSDDDDDASEMSPAARRMSMILEKMCERLEHSQAELALCVLGALTANVQDHPLDDTFRRLRVSSSQFKQSVWDIDEAQDFLYECGWMPFGEFIVLAVDANLSEPLSILDDLIRDFHEKLLNGDAEGLDHSWQYRLGLMSTTKHKMLSRSMSYTSALVEALADKLLQREEKLETLTDFHPNTDQVESLPDDASDDHVERACIKARQHWQTMEGSTPSNKPARAMKASGHGGYNRRAVYTAVIGIGQHQNMIERNNCLIGDARARQFLEGERRKRRYGSTNNIEDLIPDSGDDENKTDGVSETGVFKSEELGDVHIQGCNISENPRIPLRLISAPEPVLSSPSPVHDSSLVCEAVDVQETKKKLQKMAAELNHSSSLKQEPSSCSASTSEPLLNRTSPTTQQNGSTAQNGNRLDKQNELMDTTGIETKSGISDMQFHIQKSLSASLSKPLKSLLASDDVPIQTSVALEDSPRGQDSTGHVEKQLSSPVVLTEESLSRKNELDAAIEASRSARAKLAELGAK